MTKTEAIAALIDTGTVVRFRTPRRSDNSIHRGEGVVLAVRVERMGRRDGVLIKQADGETYITIATYVFTPADDARAAALSAERVARVKARRAAANRTS